MPPGGIACRVHTSGPAMARIGDQKCTRPVCPACARRSFVRREDKHCVFLGCFVLGRNLQRVPLLACTRYDRLVAAAAKGRVVGMEFGSVWKGSEGQDSEVGTETGRNENRMEGVCIGGLEIE